MKKFPFSWETLLVTHISSLMYHDGWHRMLIAQVVVQLSIQIWVGMSGLPAYSVPQGAVLPSVCVNIQEGK